MKKSLFIATVLLILSTLVSCKKIQETQNTVSNNISEKTETYISEETSLVPQTVQQETEILPTQKETNALIPTPAPKTTPTPTASTTPQEEISTSVTESQRPLSYSSKSAFHDAIVVAKETIETTAISKIMKTSEQSNITNKNIEKITSYLDFTNVVNEIELYEISVMPVYVILTYHDKSEEYHEVSLLIEWDRGAYGDNYNYIEEARTRLTTRPKDIYHNGNIIIKEEIYWGDEYMCNQYFWIYNGYNVHVRVPAWLLELYPEETFFDIQVLNVPAT
jgi:hypothetical protein